QTKELSARFIGPTRFDLVAQVGQIETARGDRRRHGPHLGQRFLRERKVFDRRAEGPPMLSVCPGDEVSAPRSAVRPYGVVKPRSVDHEIHRMLKPATWFAYLIGDRVLEVHFGRGQRFRAELVLKAADMNSVQRAVIQSSRKEKQPQSFRALD